MGTLLNRRRYMGGGGGLPYDAEVEYLESSGTQYIDTGVIPTNTIGVEISISYSNSKNVLIGGGIAWTQEFLIARDGSSIVFNANGSNGTNISRGNSYAGSQHIYKYENGDCYIDGELVGTNSPSIPTTTKTLCVLCYNRNSGQGEFLVGKLYYVKILNNGVLQRDLIPVRVGTTGYMYDKVSGQLFGNAGTGAFTLGHDLLTHYDAEVEYIQSSGNQYINTGIKGGSNAEYSLDFQILSGYYRQYAQLCASTRTPVAPKIYCHTSSEWRAQWQSSYTTILNSTNQYDRHVIEFKGGILYRDGSQISNIGQIGFGYKDFCICGYTEENLPCYAKIFGLQIWIDGVLVRKYKPVRVGQSGYLYDEVSGILFGDANGGTFEVGNDKT